MKIYHNGILKASASGKTKLISGATKFTIGTRTDLAGFYDGYIDDVRIYDKELNIYDINDIYVGGL